MKKVMNYAILVVAISIIGILSCDKDSNFETINSISDVPDIQVIHYNNGKGEQASMLAFKDMDSFEKIFESLENELIKHDDEFVDRYKGIDVETLNKKEFEEGFDEYKPLKDFEKKIGHKSLLNEYIEKEKEWMEKRDLNMDYYPRKFFNYLDDVELVLFNEDYAIMLGDTIYKLYGNNNFVKIYDRDTKTLCKLNNYSNINEINKGDFANTEVILIDEDKTTCRTSNHESSSWEYDYNDFRMLKENKFYPYFEYGIRIKSWTTSYKKHWYGWSKYRVSSIQAGLNGYYDVFPFSDCGNHSYYFPSSYNSIRSNANKVSCTYYLNIPYTMPVIEKYGLKSTHFIKNNGSHSATLYMYY